jgi:hypothetical protein
MSVPLTSSTNISMKEIWVPTVGSLAQTFERRNNEICGSVIEIQGARAQGEFMKLETT